MLGQLFLPLRHTQTVWPMSTAPASAKKNCSCGEIRPRDLLYDWVGEGLNAYIMLYNNF